MRRTFLKVLGLSLISSLLLPINFISASTKKLFNKDLIDEQKNIMFNEGTERPFSSELNKEKRDGFYHCANCGAKLFASTSKFDSGTGWPSFSEALPGAFKTKVDRKFGMLRTEYHCANCGAKLFSSTSKFDSGTGWPSFSEALPGAFKTKVDRKFGMVRTEYHCAKCGVHHGHVFNDGPSATGKRFCNNGLCLIFKPSN